MSGVGHRQDDGMSTIAGTPAVGRAQALWARLRTREAALGEMPPDADDLPWYLATLLGISAWIAAGFLFGFAFQLLGGLDDEAAPVAMLGIIACASGLALMRLRRGRGFAEQFGIACSLVGQALCASAIHLALKDGLPYSHSASYTPAWLGLAAFSVAMAVLGPPRLHRFLCGLFTAGGLAAAFYTVDAEPLQLLVAPVLAGVALWLWLRIARPGDAGARADNVLSPAAWAFSLVAMITLWLGTDGSERYWQWTGYLDLIRVTFWLTSLIVVLLLPLCVAVLMQGSAQVWRRTGEAAVFALLVVGAPGVAFCLMLALLGFALHRPALLGVGLLGMAVYLIRYYYQLDVPLLQKSGWLLAGGAALLLARMVWRRSAPEEAA